MIVTTLEKRKANLIVRISKLDKEESVRQVEAVVKLVERPTTDKQLELLKKLAKPIREKLDINELKREQNWKPSSKAEIDKIVKDFDWQISDEDFIKLLKDI